MAHNFYLQPVNDPSFLYTLHATTDVAVSFSSNVTTFPTESGEEVTDNVTLDPDTVSFDGVLTDVSTDSGFSPISLAAELFEEEEGTPPTWSEYIEELRDRQKRKETFYVYFSGDNAGELADFESAILTQFDINKDATLGNSWSVSVTLQDVRYANPAQVVQEPQEDYQSKVTKNQDGSSNTGDVSDSQTEQLDRHSLGSNGFYESITAPAVP